MIRSDIGADLFVYHHNLRSINPVKGWETRGEAPDGWVLEANGAFVKIQEDADSVVFWAS